jgi:hypothetical protein
VRWENLVEKRSRHSQSTDVYEVATGLYQLQEGFRVYWFRSSDKAGRDFDQREERIAAAIAKLEGNHSARQPGCFRLREIAAQFSMANRRANAEVHAPCCVLIVLPKRDLAHSRRAMISDNLP